ncbi:hypothetical protein TNCV_1002411 [Trichonephila clavipes]|nr:hypothetical protein TNCV_1002411 [Trichonephila clavipes]
MDTNSERRMKPQEELQSCISGYLDIYKQLTNRPANKSIEIVSSSDESDFEHIHHWKAVEKRRKRFWSWYLMLHKVIHKTWITSDKALFHLPFTTGKTKIHNISREKRRKDAALLEKASMSSGVMSCPFESVSVESKPDSGKPDIGRVQGWGVSRSVDEISTHFYCVEIFKKNLFCVLYHDRNATMSRVTLN